MIGGYCVGLYSYDTLSPQILSTLQEQNVTRELLALSTMYQYGIIFGIVLAAIGVVFAKKVNLWKKFELNKKAILATSVVAIVTALSLFPGDKLVFGRFSSWVYDQYTITPTLPKILSGLLTGGIIEEVMLRLFFMSLIALIISKLFFRKSTEIPAKVYIIANIIAAILFAAGHIPTTASMTDITPLLLVRCFILNGGFGLAFGYLYRKHGIGYAMIAHGAAHLIADTLLIIFI